MPIHNGWLLSLVLAIILESVLVRGRELEVLDLGSRCIYRLQSLLLNALARLIIVKCLYRVPLRLLERLVVRAIHVATVLVLQRLDVFGPQAIDAVDARLFLLLLLEVSIQVRVQKIGRLDFTTLVQVVV